MEFNPTIQHVKGSENMLADYLSRINFKETAVEVNSVEDMFPIDAKIIRRCQELEEFIQSEKAQTNSTLKLIGHRDAGTNYYPKEYAD